MPLILRIKRELHKNIAQAQDLIVQELYSVFDNAVLHGGTAIWRCYKGNRFSEDIDVYIPYDSKKIEQIFLNLEKIGFKIEKKKIKEHSLYSNLLFNRTVVRFEAIFKKKQGVLKEYEAIEGNIISVYTLAPEEFLSEKIDTYLSRLKIRDLYDMFFLLRYIEDKKPLEVKIRHFLKNFKKPIDERELKLLIFEGLAPTAEKMLEYIKNIRWEKKNI